MSAPLDDEPPNPPAPRQCSTAGCSRPSAPTRRRCYSCLGLAQRYGIDPADYFRLLTHQAGKCAICGNRPRTRVLALDHNHKTGAVRGLLCSRCNHGLLGSAHDSVAMLERAIRYLTEPPAAGLPPAG